MTDRDEQFEQFCRALATFAQVGSRLVDDLVRALAHVGESLAQLGQLLQGADEAPGSHGERTEDSGAGVSEGEPEKGEERP